MCIPHGASAPISNGYAKKERPKRHIKRVSQEQFEKGDPNFVDERIKVDEVKPKKSSIFKFFFK